jgi:hypothetical protein
VADISRTKYSRTERLEQAKRARVELKGVSWRPPGSPPTLPARCGLPDRPLQGPPAQRHAGPGDACGMGRGSRCSWGSPASHGKLGIPRRSLLKIRRSCLPNRRRSPLAVGQSRRQWTGWHRERNAKPRRVTSRASDGLWPTATQSPRSFVPTATAGDRTIRSCLDASPPRPRSASPARPLPARRAVSARSRRPRIWTLAFVDCGDWGLM